MLLQVIFALVGLIIGSLLLGKGGWLIGLLLGYLTTKVLQLTQTVQNQNKEISLLKSMQDYLHLTLRGLQPKQEESGSKEILEASIEVNKSAENAIAETAIEKPAFTEIQESQTEKELEAKPIVVSQTTPAYQRPVQQVKPPVPPRSTPADKIGEWIRDFFMKGNPVVRVGMLILFFGLSFLVKYAAGRGYFPIELRLSCVALIAIALIFIGWKTKARQGGYGLVLQGGGLAALYLTCFAAAKMYDLMPSSVALILLFVFVIFGVVLALLQNAQVLAIMAIAGGFLAPILTSDGSGNHVGLFSVYLILNLGVLAISWFKSWRLLNWIGFIFTFVISTSWGFARYETQFYASTQPFLIAFFLMYLLISILFSLKQPPNLKGLVDGSLVFGLPVAAFSLQIALLKHTEYGLAISTLVLASIYTCLARWLWLKYLQTHQLLAESFLALGVGFATLSIPLALSADWTSATWAFEAAGILWVGLRQKRLLPRIAGIGLYFAACIAGFLDHGFSAGSIPIISGDFIGMIILSFSGFLMAYSYFRYEGSAFQIEHWLGKLIMLLAILWWVCATILELEAHLSHENKFGSFYFILAAGMALQTYLAQKWKWSALGKSVHCYFVIICFWSIAGFVDRAVDYPTDWLFGLSFFAFLCAQYRYLWKMEKLEMSSGLSISHFVSALLILLLVLWEAMGLAEHTGLLQSVMQPKTAVLMIWFGVFAFAIVIFMQLNLRNIWPTDTWKNHYQNVIPLPFVLILLGWFFVASHESGGVIEFYLPIINPLDLAQLAVILLLGFVLKQNLVFTQDWSHSSKIGLLGVLGFIWINIVMLRAIHHYTHIEYEFSILWTSALVQMALSILWSICALIIMNISRRTKKRPLWIIGASLLALIVLKLFTKDLSGTGTIAQIISFMAVGGLMLLIGYLSPIPPAKNNSGAIE